MVRSRGERENTRVFGNVHGSTVCGTNATSISRKNRFIGWQAHGDTCGGQPGVANEEIQQKLDAVIVKKVEKFSDATHFRIFVTEGVVSIREITSGGG